jgi:hypothetical protein
MDEQRTFAGNAWSQKGKVTRREQFHAEMDAGIPWGRLLALIEPRRPKAGRGREPLGLEKLPRIYSMTARRCAGSLASNSVMTWCPTRRRSCASATCSRRTA